MFCFRYFNLRLPAAGVDHNAMLPRCRHVERARPGSARGSWPRPGRWQRRPPPRRGCRPPPPVCRGGRGAGPQHRCYLLAAWLSSLIPVAPNGCPIETDPPQRFSRSSGTAPTWSQQFSWLTQSNMTQLFVPRPAVPAFPCRTARSPARRGWTGPAPQFSSSVQ